MSEATAAGSAAVAGLDAAASRVRQLAAAHEPPDFAEAPGPDAALFLCAIDHRSGYRGSHTVAGAGPYSGSELIWHLGIAAERRQPGLLSAAAQAEASAQSVTDLFRIGGETVAGAEVRARLWRELAAGLGERHGGSAEALLDASGRRLGGEGGLIALLGRFEAYSDPLAKKSYLFAKIAARRGWFTPTDPESWQVCADPVLMRVALRAGLVRPDPDVERLRAATRDAFGLLAERACLAPPLLDDLLWELGRRDPDLLGTAGGPGLEPPPRPPGTFYY